jgi:hypothetical protein
MLILAKPLKAGAEEDSEFMEAYEECFKKIKAQQYVPL